MQISVVRIFFFFKESHGTPYKIGNIYRGIAQAQTPTIKNYALELFTFGTIVGVNLPVVQWTGLTLGEPPS